MKKTILVSLLSTLIIPNAFAGDQPALDVTFYYLPGCPVCKRSMEELKVVADKFQDKIVAQNQDATTDEKKPVMAALEFETHGLVIRKGEEVIWKQKDHSVKVADAEAFLEDYFKES